MLLVYCPKCGHKNLPNTLDSCPECGFSIRTYFGNMDNNWEIEKTDEKMSEKTSAFDINSQRDLQSERRSREFSIKEQEKRIKSEKKTKINFTIIASIFIPTSIISFFFLKGTLFAFAFILFLVGIICAVVLMQSIGSIERMQRELNLMKSDYYEWDRKHKERNQLEAELSLIKQYTAPRCPHCNSTNIKQISMLNRMISVEIFGLASSKIGKQFECKNCKYKW